jgi:glutathione S-transferase
MRYRLRMWLNFIGTELHKATFIPLLDPNSPDGAKTFARAKLPLRFGYLSNQLEGRRFLLDEFSVADAYLVTVLNWAPYAGVDLSLWPIVPSYCQQMIARPSVARALADEAKLYAEKVARRRAA